MLSQPKSVETSSRVWSCGTLKDGVEHLLDEADMLSTKEEELSDLIEAHTLSNHKMCDSHGCSQAMNKQLALAKNTVANMSVQAPILYIYRSVCCIARLLCESCFFLFLPVFRGQPGEPGYASPTAETQQAAWQGVGNFSHITETFQRQPFSL